MTKEMESLRQENKRMKDERTEGATSQQTKPTQTEDVELEEVNLTEESIDPKTHYTLQFLRRSVFYFLTDKENCSYHLKSIERLLEFSEGEREAIERGRLGKG